MKVLIVDDEFNSRRVIRKFLSEFDQISILEDASNIEEALQIIEEDKPDILLLDVQLKDKTSFDLIKNIHLNEMSIIFVTAYENYALQAFGIGAENYLLKPLDREKFNNAISKAIKKQFGENYLLTKGLSISPSLNKLTIPDEEGLKIIEIDQIKYIKADGAYCHIFHINGSNDLIVKPLKFIHDKLIQHTSFIRIHKSYLVNLNQVKRIGPDSTFLFLMDGTVLPIARAKKDFIKNELKNKFY